MNLEFSLNLQDLENLLTKSNCSCHFINPNKTRILLWKEVKGETIIYHLRIRIQKFISQTCLDRNGETYWKFDFREKREEQEEVKEEVNKQNQIELDPITKFNQRQAQTKDYDKSNSEPAVNS